MSLLTLQNLGITLGDPLFSDLTLTLNKGDRLGLVAANGRGKTTLMQCMTGETEPTKGDITRARGLRVGHVAQYVPNAELDHTLYDLVLGALPAEQADFESWRVDVVLGDLSVPYDLQQTQLRELSGGWQRTAMLAAAWITEPASDATRRANQPPRPSQDRVVGKLAARPAPRRGRDYHQPRSGIP